MSKPWSYIIELGCVELAHVIIHDMDRAIPWMQKCLAAQYSVPEEDHKLVDRFLRFVGQVIMRASMKDGAEIDWRIDESDLFDTQVTGIELRSYSYFPTNIHLGNLNIFVVNPDEETSTPVSANE